MRRADRLFDIIQALRSASGPMTAASLAERLEVTTRTIYRDIATLQARRVPIEGAAGIGYLLRRGFDLPPLMFTADEVDAIAVGARLLGRLRDPGLQDAAASVLAKIASILPERLRAGVVTAPFLVSDGSAIIPDGIDLAALRRAIRETRKVRISYQDATGRRSHRTVWPIAMLYYVDVTLLGAWCELRQDYRHFRVERIQTSTMLEEGFPTGDGKLLQGWFALQRMRAADGRLDG
ncbi:MAG TPA: YafY family protein [Roseomonas sp.]|jgi:predicted DNA-binding transcriptional regulator YafY